MGKNRAGRECECAAEKKGVPSDYLALSAFPLGEPLLSSLAVSRHPHRIRHRHEGCMLAAIFSRNSSCLLSGSGHNFSFICSFKMECEDS